MEQKCKNEFDVIGFGEVMLRLSPIDKERIAQGEVFEKNAGGSELNVVSGISLLGLRTGILTKLPDNNLGYYIKNKIRSCGVSDDYIVFDETKKARLGLYYYESGAYPRKPSVIYDRANSSVNSIGLDEIEKSIYVSCKIFHVSGITLGLGKGTRDVTVEMIKKFKQNNTLISFDVNFRANLWTEPEARKTIEPILKHIDILFISEETIRKMFQMSEPLQDALKEFSKKYDIKMVMTSRRKVINPTTHSFDSIAYCADNDEYYSEPPYDNIQVVDRIGSGDAFVAGALFAYLKFNDVKKCVEFGNAMAAIKNTVQGDLPSCDYNEICRVIDSHKGMDGGSEMNR